MDKTTAEKSALFRYGLIAPIIHEPERRQLAYFREIVQKAYQVPGKTNSTTYSISTLKDWLRRYRLGGIDALYPAIRKDKGQSKKIDAEIANRITAIFGDYPRISASALYRLLVSRGLITKEQFTEVTLRKYISVNKLRTQAEEVHVGRKKFEMPAANMLWTMDFLHGPSVIDSPGHNRKRKTYLCAIIDDHSRLVVGASFAFAENSLALATTLKAAILQYGIPQKLYCDNGAAFISHTLQLACARIGMDLIHSKPYDAPSRGKIERFNRTVRQKFLHVLSTTTLASIGKLNEQFQQWLATDYNGFMHSGTEEIPRERFLKSIAQRPIARMSEAKLDEAFYEVFERKVKKDATVSISGCLFEVPVEYIGQRVEIRSPLATGEYRLFHNGRSVCIIRPVCYTENAQRPHTGIHFSKGGQDDDSGLF